MTAPGARTCYAWFGIPIQEAPAIIVSSFRVITDPGQRATFARFFGDTRVPLMQGTDGIEDIAFRLPRPATPDEFAIVMHWRDLDALKAFVGEDWATPHIHPDEEGNVKERHLHRHERLPT